MTRVAVLGAYGAVGRRIVAQASARGHQVTATGRDAERVARVPADAHRVLRLDDTPALAAVAATHDVVVNATGVESVSLASALTEAGAAFLDISAESSYLGALARLRVRRPVAAGTGLAPGLTNLLAASVPGSSPLHIGIVGGAGERHGRGGREWIWRTAGRLVTSGGAAEHVFRASRRFEVPGFGTRTLLRAAFGEQDQLADDLQRPVSTWLGLDPAWATATLRLAGAHPRLAPHLDRLSGPVAGLLDGRDRWGLVVTDGTQPVRWARGRSEVEATAALAALFVEPLHRADPGVHPAHRLAGLDEVQAQLTDLGISVGRQVRRDSPPARPAPDWSPRAEGTAAARTA